MEPQSNEQSPSPSGSEEMESEGDSEQEDELENNKDSEAENEEEESNKENSDNSDDDEDDDDDEEEEEEEEEEESELEGDEMESPKSVPNGVDKSSENSLKKRKTSNGHYDDSPKSKGRKHSGYSHSNDVDCFPLDDLPLEVITTVEPTNYAYPVLKNMSNGVLTHRNIFTEHERAVLREIINKYRNIVDTRSRTREIYLEKQSVWQQIVEEYNSTENIMVRTEKELRKCWDNMKYRAKQAEKEMCKTEKMDEGFDGMDLHILAQQALEEAVRMHQEGGAIKTEQQMETQVKVEPQDYDVGGADDEEDGDSNPDPPEVESGVPAEEDREPALKKARQESPKLSSLLLAATHKRTSSSTKKSGRNNHKSSGSKFFYNIPECTKVVHMKKRSHHSSTNSSNAANTNPMSELPVSILPKGLAACLSITNIPNPVSGANHVGTNFSFQHKDVPSSLTSPVQTSMKPMPSLKKMVPRKQQINGSCKNFMSRSSTKKSNSHTPPKEKSHSVNNSINVNVGHNSNSLNGLNSMQNMNNLLSSAGLSSDNIDSPEKMLSMKLSSQRLDFERREHEVRMKLLEKELQSQTYQSQYWALKLKLLRSGRENNAFNLAGATNGDID